MRDSIESEKLTAPFEIKESKLDARMVVPFTFKGPPVARGEMATSPMTVALANNVKVLVELTYKLPFIVKGLVIVEEPPLMRIVPVVARSDWRSTCIPDRVIDFVGLVVPI